jgi:hypothetical protein
MMARTLSSRRLVISAWLLTAFAGGAWGQSIVVRQLEKRAGSEATHELEVHLTNDGEQKGTEECSPAEGKVKGKRIELIVEARVDSTGWEARLTDLDIDSREHAFDELVARARRDTSLGLAIKSWSTDSSKPELAWSARMALRELHKQRRPVAVAWVPRIRPNQTGMQEAHAVLNEANPKASLIVPVPQGLRDLNPGSVLPLANRQLMSLSAPRAFEMPQDKVKHQLRLKLQYQPEGVTLVVAEIHNGQSRQRKYAAGSIETLLEDHPELLAQIPALSSLTTGKMAMRFGGMDATGLGSLRPGNPTQGGPREGNPDQALLGMGTPAPGVHGHWVRSSGDPARGTFQFLRTTDPGLGQAPKATGPSAHILGVKVTALTLSDAEHQLLGPGVGLLIERREPGSIAEALELRRGDILVELFGQQLCSAEEITRLLKDNSGQEVKVKFVDRDGIERVRTWKPAKR